MARKNKGGGFTNYGARVFNQDKAKKIQRMAEPEIYDVLHEELGTMIQQLVDFRDPDKKGTPYPNYIKFIFQNLSSAKFIKQYLKANRKKISKEEKKAFRVLIETGYKETYLNSPNAAEDVDRVRLLMDAYFILYPKRVKRIKNKLGISKLNACELSLFTQSSEPYYNIRNAAKILDKSDLKFKKKLKLLNDLIKDPYLWYGTFLSVPKKSDFVSDIFDYMCKSKKKKRYIILGGFATSFKYTGKMNSLMNTASFLDDKTNKKLIKSLIKEDIGFKKAFAAYINKKDRDKRKKQKEKEMKPGNYFNTL